MVQGTVFDVQTYAVHDGPGIRTVVFLKGCPLRCAWCCNPESQRMGPELRHHRALCRSCGGCVEACPKGAATAGPTFDRARCDPCEASFCTSSCPEGALTRTGRTRAVEDLVEDVARDTRFFENSGGGVTFSGGEPFFQPRFLEALLVASRARGLHTAVETCGYAPPDTLHACSTNVDLFLFDVKIVDAKRHQEATGRDNALILTNLRWLAEHVPEKVVVRVPLIPGFTDDLDNLHAIAKLVGTLGLPRIELQPYHPFGVAKYAAIGRAAAMPDSVPMQTEADLQAAASVLAAGAPCDVV